MKLTTTAREVYNSLKAHGARVKAIRGDLEIEAPEPIPAALLEDAQGFKTELLEMIKAAPIKPPTPSINAADLMRREFPEPRFAVQDIIPEGLTLFAGKPKLGKSWLVLSVALAVASGGRAFGKIPVKQGAVLYLALEDSHRRLQTRLEQVLGDAPPPAALEFKTELPRLDDGGILEIQDWLESHPDARLVIIDTLARVKPRAAKNAQLYDADSDALKPLHRLALERGLAVLIVHHTRKAGADDVFDTISSSTGLTGIVDAMMVLTRARNEAQAKMSVTGRDIEEKDWAMRFDPVTALWTIDGDAKLFESLTPERRAVLEVLTQPMTPAEIAKVLGRDAASTRKLILGMKRSNLVKRLTDGKYQNATEPLQALPCVTLGAVTLLDTSETHKDQGRYRVTAKEQVTIQKVGVTLTPELEQRALEARAKLSQVNRANMDGALASARNGNTDAAARVLELIRATK
jgi:predicted transcriptional regulator